MGRRFLFLFFLPLALGCEPWIGEPDVVRGVYYVENLRDDRLVVTAQNPWGDPAVLTHSEVEAGETTEIYTHLNDASLYPSNTFGQFTVHRHTVSEETLLYSGIDDSDWTMEPGGEDDDGISRQHYTLTIGEPSNP